MGIDTGLDTAVGAMLKPLSTTVCFFFLHCPALERETGIEPASLAWKARVLPLNYSRLTPGTAHLEPHRTLGGGGWIRTSVRVSGQIYSLLPLTTRPPLQE